MIAKPILILKIIHFKRSMYFRASNWMFAAFLILLLTASIFDFELPVITYALAPVLIASLIMRFVNSYKYRGRIKIYPEFIELDFENERKAISSNEVENLKFEVNNFEGPSGYFNSIRWDVGDCNYLTISTSSHSEKYEFLLSKNKFNNIDNQIRQLSGYYNVIDA